MECLNITAKCIFSLLLHPSVPIEAIKFDFDFPNWETEDFQYQIFLNKQFREIDSFNFAVFPESSILRPLELSIFDGNLLSNDMGSNNFPITTNFIDLIDTKESYLLISSDEIFYDRLKMSDSSLPNEIILNFDSDVLLESSLISNCSYELNSKCVSCISGYELDQINNICVNCNYIYNSFDKKCIGSSSSIDYSSNLYQKNVSELLPADRSEEIRGYCDNTIDIPIFYSDFQFFCHLKQSDFLAVDFLFLEITLKVDSKIFTDDWTFPSIFTMMSIKGVTFQKEYSQQIVHKTNFIDEIILFFFAQNSNYLNLNFLLLLPNYRPDLPRTEKPIKEIRFNYFSFLISDSKASKIENNSFSVNDFCPDSWHTSIKNFNEIECFESVPNNLRSITTELGSHVIPCGDHCLSCSSQKCLSCEPGYLLIDRGFDCLPGDDSCFEVKDTPFNCKNPPDYYDALVKSVFFFDYQRAGFIPDDERRVCWRYHTFLQDQGENKEVLIGGWFDSLGTMKLNLQLSFTLLTLCQGIVAFKDEYIYAQIYDEILGIIRPALEYLLLCYVDNDNIYSHCGDLDTDSTTWTRPEDYAGPRNCFKVPSGETATDLYSTMSSAFSAASIVFKNTDNIFSQKLLDKAEALYTLARATKLDSLKTHFPELFVKYSSTGNVNDELFEAGLFLDKAKGTLINTSTYISEYRTYNFNLINGEPWEDRTVNINLLLYELTSDIKYLANLENYIDRLFFNASTGVYKILKFPDITNLHR